MTTPKKQIELPAGVMRSSFGERIVMLVDSKMPFSQNTEILKLADTMSVEDKVFRFWVFSVKSNAFDKKKNTLTIKLPNPHLVKSTGYDTYEKAEEKYVELAQSDSGKKTIARGLGIEAIKKLSKE